MKRRILPLTLALIAALFLSVNACAAAEYGVIYTEAEMLRSEELSELGTLYLPRFTAFYDTDFRVDVLTGIGDFSSLAEAAAAIYDEYDYGYGEGRNGVSLTMLVHKDEDGVALDEWYLYAAGDNAELTSDGVLGAVSALNASMSAEDWAGDAEQDTQALVNAINVVSDDLLYFFLNGDAADTELMPDAGSTESEDALNEETPLADAFPAAGSSLGYVTDTAGILSAEERRVLSEQAQEISEAYGFGVYIITVDSFQQTTGCTQVDDGAVALYQTYDLGLSDARKGVLLLLSMQERDFSLITYSDYGNYVFDEENREWIAGCFLDNFSYNDWYGGFSDYLEECSWTLAEGPDRLQSEINAKLGMIFLIPLMIAAVVIVVLSQKMKSVAKATQAEAYAGSGIDLSNSYDRFTHATETRRKRKEESSGGGGGGRTRSGSSGGFGRTSGKF